MSKPVKDPAAKARKDEFAMMQKLLEKKADKAEMPKIDNERYKMDTNAAAYVASIIDPWNHQGVRLPDLTFIRTATRFLTAPGGFGLQTGTSSGLVGGIIVSPVPYLGIKTVASLPVSENNFVWGNTASFPYTDLVSEFGAIRTISMGLTIMD